MKKIILYIFISSIFVMHADAQRNRDREDNRNQRSSIDNRRRAPSLSMGIQMLEPRGLLGDQYTGYPAGVSGLFTVNWGLSPIEFGFGAAWHNMGSTQKKIIITEGEGVGGNVFSDGTMTVRSNIYSYQAVARFKPLAGPIQPYVDVLGGFRSFSTKTKIKKDVNGDTQSADALREKRDFALLTGWAGGLKIRLNDYLMLEARMEFTKGGEVDFIDPQSIEIDVVGEIQYQEITSKTDLRAYHLGITVEF